MLNLEKPTRRVPFSIAIRMRLILFWKTVLYFFVFYRFYELEEENDDQIHRVEEENFKTSTSTKNNKKKAQDLESGKSAHGPKSEAKRQSTVRGSSVGGGQDPEDVWSFKVNDANTHDRRFIRNKIRTTKYTWLTFIPKNLFEQFSKMANVYFLFIMVLQIVPPISITGGQPAILLPLMFVVAVSAIKDLFEDIKRHRADAQENHRKALVLDTKTGEF